MFYNISVLPVESHNIFYVRHSSWRRPLCVASVSPSNHSYVRSSVCLSHVFFLKATIPLPLDKTSSNFHTAFAYIPSWSWGIKFAFAYCYSKLWPFVTFTCTKYLGWRFLTTQPLLHHCTEIHQTHTRSVISLIPYCA